MAFEQQVRATKRDLLEFLIGVRRNGSQVVAYGAPAKGNTLLNYCGVRADLLDYSVDLSPHKQGLYLPGTRLPDLLPGADRGDEARLHPDPALEPARRDRDADGPCSRLGWPVRHSDSDHQGAGVSLDRSSLPAPPRRARRCTGSCATSFRLPQPDRDGVRQTFDRIERDVPAERTEVASGTQVYDWTLPASGTSGAQP
jgi:hypothetical protein